VNRRFLFTAPVITAAVLIAAVLSLARFASWPELDRFVERPWSREYLDRYGSLLYVEPLEEGRRRIRRELEELPGALVNTFLAAEDSRFYLHPGVDPSAVLRSALINLREGRTVSGASTITMQLARIIEKSGAAALPPKQRSGLRGKMTEAWNSLRLEVRYSKDEILQLWLNSLPFGHRCEGVAAAAWTFFDQPVEELSPAQFALLSVIPRSPGLYDPVEHPEGAAAAAALLKGSGRLMPGHGELLSAARNARRGSWPNHAPHFINYLKGMIPEGEYRVETSLDRELTLLLRGRIDETLRRYSSNRLGNGSALVADNRSGEILAWVGSRSFWDEEHRGQIDGVLTRNQPGSTLKPFLYTMALQNGFLPNTILPDLPLDLGSDALYQPRNFDGRFHGPVRLRVALASSLNVPAVYLIERLGVSAFSGFLLDLGFESLRDQLGTLGTGLALGNAGVTLFELVQAYTLFSRGDRPTHLSPWKAGAPEAAGRTDYAVGLVRDILGDKRSRVLGFGSDSVMNLPFPSIFKTGTANQFQNIWAVGAVPEYSVGLWIGNFTGETVIGETGSSIPASIAAEVLTLLHRNGSGYPPVPGAVRVQICAVSGMAATGADRATLFEYLPADAVPGPCDWHLREEDGSISLRYPEDYLVWEEQRRGLAVDDRSDTGGARAGTGGAEILSPRPGSLFYLDPSIAGEAQAVRVEARGAGPPPYRLRLFLEGEIVFEEEAELPLFYAPLLRKGEYGLEISGSGGLMAPGSFSVR
jgi:penicillin-binding protein 1C